MRRTLFALLAALSLFAPPAFGYQDDFCAGFVEGFQSVRGEKVAVPACPAAPATPHGSTPFREGIKAGIRAARRK